LEVHNNILIFLGMWECAAGGAWECRPELGAVEKTLRDALTAEDATGV
jgi:hypothetical protein